jgi:hypothetical protein
LGFAFELQGQPIGRDIWGVNVFTGLPELIAPASTPVYLNLPRPEPDSVRLENGRILINGVDYNVTVNRSDETQQIFNQQFSCFQGVNRFDCDLGINVTAPSPDQIGQETAYYVWVWGTSAILGPPTTQGPFLMGYPVELRATLRAPPPCYQWNGYNWIWSAKVVAGRHRLKTHSTGLKLRGGKEQGQLGPKLIEGHKAPMLNRGMIAGAIRCLALCHI